MKQFVTLDDAESVPKIINEAIELKAQPHNFSSLGKHKTLVMLFFNSSLRTRLSTEKAAKNLGMDVSVLNISTTWNLEFEDGTKMNLTTSEHIKEATKVISQYADIIVVRAFPTLTNKAKDESEIILNSFVKYATVPIVNMESATGHPLQALADAITINEISNVHNPKIVLSWAPHPKALPHAVANSFIKMMHKTAKNFVITHPKGYELNPAITKNTTIEYNQEKALKNADFVYVKNWCSYINYGQTPPTEKQWMITQQKIGTAKFMHCLPVRRNVVVEDTVLDGNNSLVIQQANNRTYATQIVLKKILEQSKNNIM